MARTLTLRLDDEQAAEVEHIQNLLGKATASKAVLAVVAQWPEMLHTLCDRSGRIAELEDQLQDRQRALSELESVMARGLELLRQGDMFKEGR